MTTTPATPTTATGPTDPPDLHGPSAVDDAEVRADRRRRLFDAMARHDLDVVVLARPAEVAFAAGARQLWTAGSRPFGPQCVAVRATGRTHLLTYCDFDTPEPVTHDDLLGLWWNPANLARELAGIPGLADARRVGTTSSSPGFDRLLAAVAPGAEEVDAGPAVWEARLPKSPAEVDRIRSAIGIARLGLAAMEAALEPGATERDLRAAHLTAIAEAGAPTAPTEGVVCATPATGPVALRHLDRTDPIAEGQLVVLDPGAFFRGYEGGIGRTAVVGGRPTADQQDLLDRVRRATDAVIATCRPGTSGADLLAAWRSTGEAVPDTPLVTGVGLGLEPPLVDARLGHGSSLVAGQVVAVTGWVAAEGVGGALVRDLVRVGHDPAHAPEVLT